MAVAALLVFTIGAAALVVQQLQAWWTEPLPAEAAGHVFEVRAGQSVAAVARDLSLAGVMPYPRRFTVAVRLIGDAGRIRRGEYEIAGGSTPADLLTMLREGRVRTYLVTLPEGITLSQALRLLAEATALDAVLEGPDDARLLELVAPYESPEGWFFPDSYRYQRGDSDLAILRQAHRRMQSLLTESWQRRDPGVPLHEPYEALILASIIERETGLASERGQIAGVFARRLQQGMRLQTDPTVIYGLAESYEGRLRRSHLQDADNLYNTYRYGGLTPTPIALPGRGSIEAALNPEPGDSLFFVARGDGSHHFSATLEEHEDAVKRYQLQRRPDYRSTPQPQ